MNELQKYVASLQEQGLGKEEIKAKIKEWKLANQPLEKKEEDKKPSYFKDDGSGDLNPEAFSSEKSKEVAIKVNEDAKKEKDSANAIPVVESDKKDTESTPVDTSSASRFTVRDGEIIFDLEAFGSEETRNLARQFNLPENDKTYNIGAGAYKVVYGGENGPVFYSKPIGESEWSSAEDDPFRTAVIAQKLGIGDPGFDVDQYDIEIPEIKQIETEEKEEEELVMGAENIEAVEIPLLVDNKSKYKINGNVYTYQNLDSRIRRNDPGFEKINSVKEYLDLIKQDGNIVDVLPSDYEGSVEEKYDNFVNITTISSDEEVEIDRFVNNINFTPYKQNVVQPVFIPGATSAGALPTISSTQEVSPYEEELDKARLILENERKEEGSNEPITKQEIEGLARQIIKNEKVFDASNKLKKDYLENLPEDQRKALFSFVLDRVRENEKIYDGKLPKQYTDPETGENYTRKELEERFDFEARFDDIKNGSLVNHIKTLTSVINLDQEKLVSLAKEIKEKQANGFDVTELSQEYNSVLKLMNTRIEAVNSGKKDLKYAIRDVQLDYSKYIKKSQEYQTDVYELNWLKRNYSQMRKYLGGLGEAGDITINSISYALGGLQQLLALIELGASPASKPGLRLKQQELLRVQSDFIDFRGKRLERYVEAPKFENAFDSFGNFGEYLLNYGLELAPFYATMIGTTYLTGNPYAGVAAASGTTGGMYAGERYNEMLNGGRPYDPQEMNLTMTGYSIAEIAGAIPEWKILKGIRSRFKGTAAGESLETGFKAWGRRRLNGLPEYAKLVIPDAVGELGITLPVQNALDGKPLLAGFDEAAFNTVLFSHITYVTPIVAGGIYSSLSSPKINAEFNGNVAEYNNIENSLYDNRFKTKVIKSSLTPEQVQQMKNTQLELLKSNEKILLDLNKKIKEMDAEGFKVYSSAMTRIADLQNKAEEIRNNPGYDFKTKERLIQPLRIEFENLVNARNVFTEAFTKTFKLLPKDEQKRINALAVSNLQRKGISNPNDNQIYEESEQIHIEEKFKNNIEKGIDLLNSLKQKGLNISFSLGRTNKETITRYRKMLDARVKDPKNNLTEEEAKAELEEFIEGIEDGTMNGTTFVTTQTNAKGETKLVYDVIVSQQNSVSNQASETTFHELNHIIFSEALGTNSKAFEPVAASILDYLADNNFNAYLRITQKADTTKADEVIIAFLEELSSKRININKANNFNLWNLLAYGVNNSIKANNTESKFNMDFSGPNGALQFFQTLANAWNNKELSVDALNKIVDSDVWQGEFDGALDEVVVTAPSGKRSKLTPRGIKLLDGFKEGIYTNKDLVAIVRTKPLNQEQRDEQYGAAEAIVESNFGLIKGIIGYERRGVKGIDENNIKQAIVELILGGDIAAWSGKKTALFEEGEGYNPDFEVTTYLGRLRNRAGDIYERAKDLGDVVFNTSEITDGNTDIVETDVETETTPVKEIDVDAFKILKKPNKKVIVSSILEKIKTGEINLDSDITLKDLKPFAEAAAQQIADELGIPVSRILNPKDNLRKGEVTPIQMFIKNNAPALLSMIKQIKGNADILTIKNKNGKTIKVGGEGRKLGQKLLDAFYIQLKGADGKPLKVNNQIQYRLDPNKLKLPYFLSVFGMDAKGNIKDARSGTAQASKNIMELLSRLLTLNSIEIAIDQQVAEGTKTESEGARQKAQVKRSKVKRNWGKGKFPVELPLLIRIATNVLNSKGIAKKAYDLDTAEGQKFVSTIKSFIEAYPELGDYVRRAMTGGYGKTFTNKVKFDKYIGIETKPPKVVRLKYGTRKNGVQVVNKKAIQRLIDDPSLISKDLAELKKLFLAMQEFMVKNKDAAPDLARIIADLSVDMNSPLRYLAPTIFYPVTASGKIDIVRITEEHMMPAIQMGKQLFDAAIKGNVESEFKIIEKSYAQGALRYNDDLALKPLGLNEAMPSIFYETVIPLIEQGKLDFLPDGLASWIRYSSNNTANPFLYKLVNPKMTIGEFFVGKLNIKSETGVAIAGEKANELITKVLSGEITLVQAKAEFKVYSTKVLPLKIKAAQNIDNTFGKKVMRSKTVSGKIKILEDYQTAIQIARDPNAPVKGISVLDFDDTVAITNSNVIVEMPDGTIRKINATEFALEHSTLESMGAKFDFSEFNKVVQGRRGPLFDKLKKAVDKFGNSNVYILTARTPEAATAIHEWLKSEGITLRFKNIVGLADGAAQAKANWIVGKAAEGYNDFYFADDALLNVQAVQAVYDVLDIKGRSQIALRSKQKNFETIINDIIEKKTGIEAYKQYSPAKAQTIGANKGKFTFFIPPSAEDFTGLLYKLLGKGKVGDAQMAFFKDNLIDPYNRAEIELESAKVAAASDFNALKAQFPNLPKSLKKETGIGKFTFEHAIRAYIWGQQGMSIPGLSKRDLKRLSDFVKADPELKVFADQLISLRKGKEYPAAKEGWVAGTITTDIINGINKIDRKQYLKEWKDNIDIIFSDKVINKLEAAFGANYVKALRASIDAMYRGSNRSANTDSITTKWYDWINNSVGVVMFLNTRSALLQMISNVNFVNWKDNNPLQAAKAFANQGQYWKDVMFLLNSPYLKARRDGLKINISESEIADLAQGKGNKAQKFIALALEKGFVFTRYADSFAIATGGATFYRNRYNSYIKEGMSPEVASKQAFEDFRDVSETSQQSSNPSKISQQQRSAAGRLILSFGNTQMQYARIQKRAIEDLVNGRGDWKTNISKILYYGAIQNLIFNGLQQGVQFLLFEGDESDEKEQTKRNKRIERTLNGMIDSQLRGLGIYGALSVTLKNTLMEIAKQADSKSPDYAEAIDDLFSISPPLQSKLRKLKSAANTFSWNEQEMKKQGIDIDNPAYLAVAQVISAVSNIPVDEAVVKINAIRNILSDGTEKWQKVALALGWGTWDVGLPYYGVQDQVVVTPEMEAEIKVENMMKETTKSQQVETLLKLGLTKKEIKALKYEKDRVNKIIKLQNQKEDGK